MREFFKVFSVFMIISFFGFCLVMTGCSDDEDDPAEPDPTATPSSPTPTPTPQQHSGGNCRRGSVIVKVTNIPVMNDQNKDEYNKTLLFCLQDDQKSNFMGVFHRYLQPDYPNGPWHATWRFEAGAHGCIEEWHILQSDALNETEISFEVTWDHNNIQVRHLGNGDTQNLSTHNVSAFSNMSEDGDCTNWGWVSPATAQLISFTCQTLGDPTGC